MIKAIAEFVERELVLKLSDNDFLVTRLVEEAAKQGLPADPKFIGQRLRDPATQIELERIRAQSQSLIRYLIRCAFGAGATDRLLEDIVSETGIFSVSAKAENVQLWGLYASSGKGFVVEFDPMHPFFLAPGKTTSLFRRVKYTDDSVSALFDNPYYLFLVKNRQWQFEDEWRITKKLSECDENRLVAGDHLYLCNVKPGMIKSVIFGY